jgi:hypothetical protein
MSDNNVAQVINGEVSIHNGIGVFKNFFSKEYCNSIIDTYCKVEAAGLVRDRASVENVSHSVKHDTASVPLYAYLDDKIDFKEIQQSYLFLDTFWNVLYPEYKKVYGALDHMQRHVIRTVKLQKTLPGQGYHVWHCEKDCVEFSNRLMAYILYLNDVEEGGETEFLYQSKRVKPEAGTFLLFPAGYMYTHRGNPPLSGEKYIVTGWVEF